MTDSYLYALIGGILIGLSAASLLFTNGRILGVSGIIGGALQAKSFDLFWRLFFITGMFVGALLIEPLGFTIMETDINRSLGLIGIGGLLVGFGTTIGRGCTSGHGVCGIGRFSPRSLVATLCFMIAGIFTVSFLNFILAASS